MAKKGIRPNIVTYGAILKGYCQACRFDKAYALFEDMKRHPEFKPDEITFNMLLDGCARTGLYDKGMCILREMEEAGVRPSNFTLSVLAKLANRSKQPEKAFDLIVDLSKKHRLRPNLYVYNNLVQACAMLGDTPRTLSVLEEMFRGNVRPDARTYTLALRGCLQAGAVQDAAGLFRMAFGLRGAHPRLAGFELRPTSGLGLSAELVTEVLDSIAAQSSDKRLAAQLLQEVSRRTDLRLDHKLTMRLTSVATP
jgi:pentatricopeptide repeat domain-containing protein 1